MESLWRLFIAVALALAATAAAAQEAREIDKLFRSGDTALAMQRVDKAIAEKPRDAALRFQRAVMLTELQRTNDAIDALNKLIEDFPDLPEPYNNLAVLLAAQGRIDSARGLLETAIRHDPDYAVAHENLGDVFIRLAQREFERAGAAGRSDEALQRKLKLTRDLAAASRPARP
ncbi:MAG TPA: tetratricopeptide repeat protein [Burkholderiaceae bacterium]